MTRKPNYKPIVCVECGVEVQRTSATQRFCPPCGKASRDEATKWGRRKWVQNNPEAVRTIAVRKNIRKWAAPELVEGIVQVWLNRDGLCQICGVSEEHLTRVLCVDHCHETRKFRGLLCYNCNRTLGSIGDSLEWLDKAKEYLSAHLSQPF